MKERVEIQIAQNGILVDWGDTDADIYQGNPEEISEMMKKLVSHLGGFYSEHFSRGSIHVTTKVSEVWADNQGI